MTLRALAQRSIRKSVAVLACFLLLGGGSPGLLAQASTGAITGVILDPTDHPSMGFRVIVRDVGNNTRYTSAPTDAAGTFTLHLPVGGSYQLEGVIADDGVTRLPVQDVPPINLLSAEAVHLDVHFTRGATPASEGKKKKQPKSGVPWYRQTGPIVGMILGSAVLAAIALSDSSNASPSQP